MKNIIKQNAAIAALIIALGTSLFAQSAKETAPAAAPSQPQTVNAQQAGVWTVGIDPAKNAVKLLSSDVEPVAVKLVGSGTGRKPFQTRISANVDTGSTANSAYLAIPAGKRLVIENISAIGRTAPGTRMQMQFFSYLDNGDGIDGNEIVFHRIALTDQGVFNGIATSSANHKVLIFADEQIGTSHYGLVLEVRTDLPAAGGITQGQITLSGYVEDLPTP